MIVLRCNCCRSTCDAGRCKEEISERLSNLQMTKTAAEWKSGRVESRKRGFEGKD